MDSGLVKPFDMTFRWHRAELEQASVLPTGQLLVPDDISLGRGWVPTLYWSSPDSLGEVFWASSGMSPFVRG